MPNSHIQRRREIRSLEARRDKLLESKQKTITALSTVRAQLSEIKKRK